jgi:tryptophan-rich sensory protein
MSGHRADIVKMSRLGPSLQANESRAAYNGTIIAQAQIMTTASINSTWRRDIGFGMLSIIAVAAVSAIGQFATYPNLAPWYAGLLKPSFNPPNWVFAPVWTVLYVLMAFAVWRILRLPEASGTRRLALTLFFIQLALNAAWSWMFFGANNPLLGLINIVPQFLAILATVIAFYRLDRMAAWCLFPLVAWVAFASILNVAIWQLNI